ncbi:MAG: GH116 family glycosyl-hydrolase [Chloroflexota bacterium]|nr:GH116 family glycosyl-hydrolase [Chloroflexota bacterium]
MQSKTAHAAASSVYWGFEDGTLQGWQVVAGSFGQLITNRAYFHNRSTLLYDKEGTYFLSTLEAPDGSFNDGYTGVIVSPQFTLTHPSASMLIGGGNSPSTYVAACVVDTAQPYNCREVAKAQGNNDEILQYETLNLSAYIGQTIFFKVVDNSTAGWGHVTLDDVRANAPVTPQGLATTRNTTSVAVSWHPVPEAGIAGYNVYRSTSQTSGYTRLNSSLVTTTSYVDTSVDANLAHFYAVSAMGTDGTESEQNLAYTGPYQDLFARGSTTNYTGANLTGIEFPVGPIGAGGILHFGDASRNEGWIFNVDDNFHNRTQGLIPNSFFAIRAQPQGGTAVVRALQTTAVGSFPATQSLAFQGEYPLGTYQFSDSALPVQVTEQVENPMIPGNLKDSAIPTAIYDFTVKNTGSSPTQVSLLATQQNAVGYDGSGTIAGTNNDTFSGYGANTNTVTSASGVTQIQMVGGTGAGSMNLAMLAGNTTATASWTGNSSLFNAFSANGSVSGVTSATSPAAQTTVDGAIANTLTLSAGQSVTIPVVLSWYFPTANRSFGGNGLQYTNFWSDATNVEQYVTGNLNNLQTTTQLYHDTLYRSNLPQDMLDRISSGVAILHTPTVFWAQNGFFGGWEGYGCCPNMPTHVWEYAQAQARLWPQIGEMFEQQWFNAEQSNGLIPYRYGYTNQFAFDGQTGVILSAYRDYLDTGDTSWLTTYWPRIKLAMDYIVNTFDPHKNGILQGAALTTLDNAEPTSCPWLGSMYLAAINASAHMASVMGDTAAVSRYQSIYAQGQVNQEQLFWNGSYYVEKPQNAGNPLLLGNAVDINMLLGQWWSTQLGLGDIYNSQHMTQALQVLYQDNYQSSFLGPNPYASYAYTHTERGYVEPLDAGMLNDTWPNNDKPANHVLYDNELFSGSEYPAAAEMIQRGLLTQGLTEVNAIARRYDGRLRNDAYLTFGSCGIGDGSGNPFGDDECGKWYGRSLSSWSLLLAAQGFTYNQAAQTIGFAPTYSPSNHQSFFNAGTSWGTFLQQQASGTQTDQITLASGSLPLQTVTLTTAAGTVANGVAVTLNSAPVSGVQLSTTGNSAIVTFPGLTIAAGATLKVQLNTQPGGFQTNLSGWSVVGGSWTGAIDGEHGANASGDAFYVASQSGSNFTYEGDLTITASNTGGSAAALVFRSQSNPLNGSYVVNISTENGGQIKLFKFPYVSLGVYSTPISVNTTYHLKVVASGPSLQVFLNNGSTPIIQVTDSSYTAGFFGLNVWRGSGRYQNVQQG